METSSFVFYVILPIVFLMYYYLKHKYSYWEQRGVVHIKPNWVFGNMNDVGFKVNLCEKFQEVYNKFRDDSLLAGIYFMTSPCVILIDPELIKTILVKDFNRFHDRGVFYNEHDDPLSANLFAIEGETWKFLRSKLSPTFTSGKMKMMFSTISNVGNDLLDYVEKHANDRTSFDGKDIFVRYTCDVIASCAFGLETTSLKDDNCEMFGIANKIFKMSLLRTLYFIMLTPFRTLARKLHLTQTEKDVTSYFMRMLKETVDYREKTGVERKDFLQLLMQLKNIGHVTQDDQETVEETIASSVDRKFTFAELAAQAFIFFFAGFETSSTTMSFALYELAKNKQIQERVRQEIEHVLIRHDGVITYAAVMEMRYLDQIVNETLRKYSPVNVLIRVANERYEVPNGRVVLEKGMSVFVPVYAIHKDPKYYPHPEEFDPERFSPEETKKRHPYTFLPFGEGPRSCIGIRFGLLQIKFGLAVLLTKYQFRVNAKTSEPIELEPLSVLMAPKGGIWLEAEKI